jgi:hypothetical protein
MGTGAIFLVVEGEWLKRFGFPYFGELSRFLAKARPLARLKR